MKAILQVVRSADVYVEGKIISSIGLGLCILINFAKDDTEKDMDYIANKILKLRLFQNDNGQRWNSSVVEKKFDILCVSQFTLYRTIKGTKPSFHRSMPNTEAERYFNKFVKLLGEHYDPKRIKAGKFGAEMAINVICQGPVTMELESPKPDDNTKNKTPKRKTSPKPKKSSKQKDSQNQTEPQQNQTET